MTTFGDVYTEIPYRRRGLGRRVVSHITERDLREGRVPIYWTEPDNMASQRLCMGLGYRQYGQNIKHLWRRP